MMVKWGTKYGPEYVNRLAAGVEVLLPLHCDELHTCLSRAAAADPSDPSVQKNLTVIKKWKIVVFTEDPEGIDTER